MRVIMIGLRDWAATTSGWVCANHPRQNEPAMPANTSSLLIAFMVSSWIGKESMRQPVRKSMFVGPSPPEGCEFNLKCRMSNVRRQMYLSNDQITQSPNE